MPPPTEYDTVCQTCGASVPAGTPQKLWVGPLPRCTPCDEKWLESFSRYKRTIFAHREFERQAKDLESRHSDYAWEGGALGQTKQCDNCGDPHPADRYRWFFFDRDLCGACEDMALYDRVNDKNYKATEDNANPWKWKSRLPGEAPR